MKTLAEMTRDLDSGGAHYSQDLSEVDLSDPEDVKVRVNDPAGDVLVHLGSSDYLRRYKIYVSHAQAWRQLFQKLESVDLRYDNQIIVNPDMQRTAKAAELSPASAKLAAAAGVKPAALITRLPHDRAVPKPAFELTQKTLDAKAAPAGTRKAAVKTKVKKAGLRTGKVAAGVKKPTASAKPATSTTAKNTVAPKISSPTTGDSGARQATNAKQPPSPSSKPTIKPSGSGAGQKPSPGIVKSQTSQGPSQ
jgi:cell division protein FtsQ